MDFPNTTYGKTHRLNRLLCGKKFFGVALDHGVTDGATGSLSRFTPLAESVINEQASAIIVHKGMVRFLPDLHSTGLIVHLSASTNMVHEVNKIQVCTVSEALELGADGVSVHINLSNQYEQQMIKSLGDVSRDAARLGMPLLAMVYMRDDENHSTTVDSEHIAHAIRLCAELGADIVKTKLDFSPDIITQIAKESLVPIVISGGEKIEEDQFIQKITAVMKTGVLGICCGRNIFESDNPTGVMRALRKVVQQEEGVVDEPL